MKNTTKRIVLGNLMDVSVQDYLLKVRGLPPIESSALNTLVTELKVNSLWDKFAFLWVCPVYVSSVAAAQFYLKPFGSYKSITIANNPPLSRFVTDGFQSLSDTHLTNTNIPTNQIFTTSQIEVGQYSVTNNAGGFSDISDAAGGIRLALRWNDSNLYWDAGSGGGAGDRLAVSNGNSTGLWTASLSGSTSRVYRNGVLQGSGTITNASSVTSLVLYVLNSSRTLNMTYALNKTTFSASEVATFYSLYRNYLASVGRTVY
jgi:hypothetical protein